MAIEVKILQNNGLLLIKSGRNKEDDKMAKTSMRSIEEQVEDLAKKQLDSVKYFTKTETINLEIETALKTAPSKSGGSGSNIPDIKLFLETATMRRIPVMIEVKGKKGDFIKLTPDGEIDNKKKDGTENFTNINKYAVNGAVHYANAIVEYTSSYKEAVAIGINGYYDESGVLVSEIGVYYISSDNFCIPKKKLVIIAICLFYQRKTNLRLLKKLIKLT